MMTLYQTVTVYLWLLQYPFHPLHNLPQETISFSVVEEGASYAGQLNQAGDGLGSKKEARQEGKVRKARHTSKL